MSDRIVVPACEGRGAILRAKETFRCTDLEGSQCGDLFAFTLDDIKEYLSAEHTRVALDRLFPEVGQSFFTNRRQPILRFEEDATPGRHDMLIAACDPTRFATLGVEGWHPSCQENLEQVMAREFGHEQIEIPAPVNIFANIKIQKGGTLDWRPALTKPGDSVTFRAEIDCYVVLTACSQDILPINDNKPTSLALEVMEDDS
jgi:uncharacterized protein YcgI (DUF1989 family)